MAMRIKALCGHITDNPRHYPPRVFDAAERLSANFGSRKTISISKCDMDAYLSKAAGEAPAASAWKMDGAAELACYDIYMLGTMAMHRGESVLSERVREWLAPYLSLLAGKRLH